MKIAVIGAGNMASAFVKQLGQAGHSVQVASRTHSKAQQLASEENNTQAVALADAASGADLIVLATGYAEASGALQSLGDITDKVIVDITNPLTADYMGLTLGFNTSAAEEIAKAAPQSHVVKAFNTLFAQVLAEGADFGGGNKVTVFYAGDNDAAKAVVRTLIESMGFSSQDAGGLKNARYLEPLAGLNIYLGYGAGMGTSMAPAWIQRA